MPRNARKELDKLLLEIAISEGPLVQRVLVGVIGFMFLQPEDVPEHRQAELLTLQEQSAKFRALTPQEARVFVMQLVQLRNQLIEDQESTRLAAFRTTA